MRGGESYEPLPSTRFNIESWKGDGLGLVNVQRGSFLKDIDLFDHAEFGVSSRDARAMAPATRLLLEQSFLALFDSGIDYRNRRVGCFMSANLVDLSNVAVPEEYELRGSFARGAAMIANRVSLHLDLLGPSIPLDTACSSSQTAFHLAVQAILQGDCESAVVGGCQLNHRVLDWIEYSQLGVLAPDGKCKPFDASADGFGRAEGCVAVVLKPLADALRDYDRIYATVCGTSTNNNGAGGPPAAPVAQYQADAMKAAFLRARRDPRDVSYVEVHATGTAKGDPTEANWVGEHCKRDDELLIGSVKGNIGCV
ncbi:thiolase-like protein [Mycena pura]|uniref:Thiolase-like protein n=1 Tax=Mycena pura TaxID=153505 RepID=A0AAD6UUU3_9AGAR|nr:thiolase-like protein [Mycena pura]